MGCLGRHLALTEKQVKHLYALSWRGAAEDDEDLDDVDERLWEAIQEIEGTLSPRHYEDTDKAWDPLHRALTLDNTIGGQINTGAGTRPLNLVFFDGEDLILDDEAPEYSVLLAKPDEVALLASALAEVDELWLRKRFFALDPAACGYDIDEDEFDYAWSNFRGMPAFYARAAGEGRAVLFTVSH